MKWHEVRFCGWHYFVIPDHCALVSLSTGRDDDGDKDGVYR